MTYLKPLLWLIEATLALAALVGCDSSEPRARHIRELPNGFYEVRDHKMFRQTPSGKEIPIDGRIELSDGLWNFRDGTATATVVVKPTYEVRGTNSLGTPP